MYTEQPSETSQLNDVKTQIYEIMDSLPCCLYKGIISKDGTIKMSFISDTAADVLGVPAKTIIKDSSAFYSAIAPDDRAWIYNNHKKLLHSVTPATLDRDVKLVNGKWMHFRAYPKKDTKGNILWDGIIFDVSIRKAMEEKLNFLAFHDALTNIGNRRLLLKELPVSIENARKNKKKMAVVSLIIDGLGKINATYGMTLGDQVLKKIISKMALALKKEKHTIFRLDGNHFVITLQDLESQEKAKPVISKITTEFSRPLFIKKREMPLVLTMGVSFYPTHGRKADTLIAHANAALDFAERTNHGSVGYFSDELSITLTRNMHILTDLRMAITKEDIIPYFQPQVDINTGKIIGIETLARWQTNKGIVPPTAFIPIAEEYGLIEDITWQILRKACIQAKIWNDKGYGEIPIAVNLSGQSFKRSGFLISQIRKIISETGVPPRLLELELTESTAMLDPALAIATLNELEKPGITCAIDDFGTGYSSLSTLKTFPLKKLKIDRSFIMDLNIDDTNTAIVRATIAIGKALNLTTIAEGAENKAHIETLKKLGCDAVQGYFFSCPLSADKMDNMLKKWDAKKVLASIR